MVNKKIKQLQKQALSLIKDFRAYCGELKRYNSKGEVNKILKYRYIPIDRETMDRLLQLKLESDLILDDSGKKDSFYNTMKLIKPNCTITSFKEKIVKRYQLITSKDKVINYLPGELERRINILKKRNRKLIKENDFSKETIQKIQQEEQDKISHAREECEQIIKNPNNYEVLITTMEDDLSFPALYIKYYDENGNKNRYNEHLREDNIPNIFVYEPEEKLKYANNKKVKNLKASGAEYLLGTILYKKITNGN